MWIYQIIYVICVDIQRILDDRIRLKSTKEKIDYIKINKLYHFKQ